MSATDYLNNAQEWLAQQSQRTIDYQWEIQHHNQMHKAYETSWQVFLDLSNFQQQYNGQEKTICLFHTNRPTKGGWLYSTPPLHLTLYTFPLSPLTHTRLSCARRWSAVSPCLSSLFFIVESKLLSLLINIPASPNQYESTHTCYMFLA